MHNLLLLLSKQLIIVLTVLTVIRQIVVLRKLKNGSLHYNIINILLYYLLLAYFSLVLIGKNLINQNLNLN